MTITKKTQGSALTIALEGRLDTTTAPELEAELNAALDGVTEAAVSHEAGTALVTLSKPVADETLKAAVEAEDYAVTGIAP